MKTCNTCLLALPALAFHSKSALCKPCKKQKDNKRVRNGYNPDKDVTPAARAKKRRWFRLHGDPVKSAARRIVRTAIERGELKPRTTCERCGNKADFRDGRRGIQAHHNLGYENPLAVEWLCPKCHRVADSARNVEERK